MGTRVLGLVGMLSLLACEGAGNEPASQLPEGYRARLAAHKVQLTAEQARQLEERGASAQVIADYGAFKLVQVDDRALASLPEGAEPRDDYNDILLNAGVIDTASEHGQQLRGMKQQATTGKRFHLVQFAGPVQPAWYRELEATGVQIVSYIPNNAYLVYGDAPTLGRLQQTVAKSAATIQWDGAYLDDYKLNPSIHTVPAETFEVQLIKDEEANSATLELIRSRQSRDGALQEALGYVNVTAYLTVKDLYEIAARPDVLSIQPRPIPRKFDERQNMIVSGNLTGTQPNGPGWLAWLASKGFTQAQFTASGFGVDVTDSGVDNATQLPNHFGLYVAGDVNGTSRVVYNRLEGTPNAGSTTQGCDGHGNINTHIIGGYSTLTGAPYEDTLGFNYGMGVAPFVKVGSSVIFDPGSFTFPDYEDLQSRAYSDGMRVSSNSWGANTAGAYTSDSQRYDALVRDAQQAGSAVPAPGNQEMVIIFAAGNSGPSLGSVGSPGTAKNIITAGASENVQAFGAADQCGVPDTGADSAMDIINFSSRGPTQDGRKKPELVAPGTHVSGGVAQAAGQRANPPANPNGQALGCFDATGVCAGPGTSNFFPLNQQWYTASSGTSHSTPAIAGGAALVRQYFINDGKAPPSAAMTKAYLMNSARYMTGVSANDNLWSNHQGMGLMDLGMAFDGVPRLMDDQNPTNLFTATGQTRIFNGVVADTAKPFRVTLAWTDAPGNTTGSAWKNNLDLSVTVGGNTYKGNVFTGANSVTGGTADGANNAESVFLPAGVSGPYTVTVTATNINSDGVPGNSSPLDQDFAVIAYNTCQTAPAAPSGVSAAVSGNNSITVSWTANGADSYNLYRATVAGGPYTKVGSNLTATTYTDTTVSGGTTYFYVVRGVLCAESANSTEVSATATGACTLQPTFAGVANVTNNAAATCGTTVTWAAGAATCGGTLSYSVYRSTTAGFTPSIANRIATGLTGTSFSDTLNLAFGTQYYYIVRATETGATTVEETNTVQKSVAPTGPTAPGVYLDDLDGNRPPNADAYWIPMTDVGTPGTLNVTTGCHYQSATKSWRFGTNSAACGGAYFNNTTATLVLGGNGTTAGVNGFTIPTGGSPTMQFNIWYSFETSWDGGYLLYSTTGANGPWTQVRDTTSTTAPWISAGLYDGALNDFPSIRAWTGTNAGANGALKAVTVNLTPVAGQKVWFAFRFYSEVVVTQEGMYLDDVRVSSQIASTCTTNTPPPGPAVTYKITGLPATAQAGTATTFTVTAQDVVGQTATSYTGSASFSSTDAQATLPPATSFTAGVAANVPITFRTLGAQSVTAKDTVNTAITGSGSTTITAGPPTGLAFKVQPSTTVAGVAIAPAVQVGLVDQFGNAVTTGSNSVTLALGANPGGGTLGGTLTATMTGGVATFSNLTLDKAATGYTLVASATGLAGATSAGFEIKPAPASKLAFLTQPSNSSAGVSITPAVQVALLDAFGNTSTSTANVTVALGTNPSGSALLGTTTVAAVNGVATFGNLALTTVGTGYTLDASSGTLTGVTSAAFDISPGTPHHVKITQQPSDVLAAMVITPAVQATVYDKHNNVATQATKAVSVSIGNNPAGGTLSGTTSVVPVNGVATFDTLSVNRVGQNYTLVAGGSGLFSDNSVGFDVGVGAPAELLFTASPAANVVSGAPFTAKVAVRDAGGNLVTGAGTQVTLSLNNAAGATLGGTLVATAVNGVATFAGLSVDKAGSGYSLEATATGVASATSPAFSVDPGAPAALVFQAQPSDATSGAAIAPAVVVAVQDAQGNLVTSSSAKITVALGSNPSSGTLSGTKAVNAINGVATFGDLSVDKAGTGYSLTASTGSLNATSSAFNIAAGAGARLVLRTGPANAIAGAQLGAIEVEIQDAAGNLTTSTAQVSLSLGGASGGTLGGTTTRAAVGGVATFADLSIQKAATGYTLTAGSSGLENITSGAFDISPAAAAALAFSVQPSNSIAGAAIAPAVKVSVLDAFGNLVTSSTANVSVALAANASGGTLSGTASAAAVNGVATFGDLAINRSGTGYTLNASAGTLTGATSSPFNVSAGAEAQLVFKLAPSSTTAGSNLGTVTVEVQDAQGNRANSSASITVSLQGGQGGTLAGTTTVSASGGQATFGDLSIAKAGVGYQLKAQATSMADATSSAFDIAHGPAAALVYTVQPGNTSAGSPIAPAVKLALQDAFGNVATSATNAVTVAIGTNPKNGTLSGTTTVNATNGVASFANLSINKAAQGYTLVASTGALPSVTSSSFNVTPGNGPKLVFRTVADQVTAGDALPSIQVELQDELGNLFDQSTVNVTLSIGDNSAGGQLFGRATVAAANGTVKFDGISLRRAGAGYTLVASAQGFEGATSTAFNVTPAAAASYALTIPSSATAGQETSLSAAAYDAYGNAASNYGGSVKVTSSDTTATLASTAGFVEGVLQGVKVTFKTPGLRTVTITDSSKATLTGTAQINVTPFAQPTVVVNDPAGGSTVEGKVSITATGGVAQGTTVAKLAIFVDGKEIASGTEATLTGTWDTDEVEGGSHVITAVVTDGAGSMVSSAPVIVFTDSGCGCGATSGTDAGIYLALLVLARYVLGRRRKANAQV